MNHRDQVQAVPEGFEVLGGTSTCAVAAIAHRTRPLMAVQFHPEVAHTEHGHEILANFVFGVCGCTKDWDPKDRIGPIEKQIRAVAAAATCSSSSAAAWIPRSPTRCACARWARSVCSASTSTPG